MKKILLTTLAAAAFVAVSCDSTGGGNKGDGTTPLTPEENRAKLEDIGMQMISLASPDKQQELLEVIDTYFYYIWEPKFDFELVDNDASNYGMSASSPVSAVMQTLKQVISRNDIYSLNAMARENSAMYRADRVYGIYELKSTSSTWSRTDSDEKLEFRFPVDGETVTVTLSASGKTYYFEYEDEYTSFDVDIPEKLTASVTKGGTSLCSVSVEGEYNEGSGPVNQELTVKAGAYDLGMSINISSTRLAQSFDFNIDGQDAVSTQVTVYGKNLCDVSGIIDNVTDYNDALTSLEATISILDLNIYAACPKASDFINRMIGESDKMDEWDDPAVLQNETPFWSEKGYNEEFCNYLNSLMTVQASYSGAEPFADFLFKSMYREGLTYRDEYLYTSSYGSYTMAKYVEYDGYATDFIIKFKDDGAEYLITDYFDEEKFSSVVDAAESLSDRYAFYMTYLFE